MSIVEFLRARLDEDEAMARTCAEMFPSPWEVSDRGWRVRIYASEVPETGDHAEPDWVRYPVVMEVEPDRNLDDPLWLSERVEHIARHDPARVLREVEAKRRIVDEHPVAVWIQPESTLKNPHTGRPRTEGGTHLGGCKVCDADDSTATYPCDTIRALAAVYSDHPDYREEEWA